MCIAQDCEAPFLCACTHLPNHAEDMNEDERELWTEKILQWMCDTQTGSDIRFACGQALTGMPNTEASLATIQTRHTVCQVKHIRHAVAMPLHSAHH